MVESREVEVCTIYGDYLTAVCDVTHAAIINLLLHEHQACTFLKVLVPWYARSLR